MLAGAQLGITACTFALGAVTKLMVHYAMTPMFDAWGSRRGWLTPQRSAWLSFW